MFVNIVILLFSVAVAALLFRFGIPTVKSFSHFYQRFLPAFGLVMVFLAVNLGMTFWAKGGLEQVAAMTPTTSLASLQELRSGEPVVLAGTISPDNTIQRSVGNQEYVAYSSEDDGLRTPLHLVININGGQIELDNDTYAPRNWPRHRDVRYLSHDQSVVIVGETIVSVGLFGANKGQETHSIHGILIYAGTHAEFVSSTTRRLWGPRIMAGLNAFALGAIALGTVITGFRIFWQYRPQ